MEYGVYIAGHQGLGDHILCSGIYREYAQNFRHVVVPVYGEKVRDLRDLLKDVHNIQLLSFKSELWEMKIEVHRDFLKKFTYKPVNLGHLGKDFFTNPRRRLDENYYSQAELPLEIRWESFKYVRNLEKEIRLFELLKCKPGRYIFVHDDPERGFNIDESLLPPDIEIIRPKFEWRHEFSLFNYMFVLENSAEVHVIESSFCAFIESMQLDIPKFAHRYSRPEAKNDYRHEFTYKSDWKILL
jgi:hypothetical protein